MKHVGDDADLVAKYKATLGLDQGKCHYLRQRDGFCWHDHFDEDSDTMKAWHDWFLVDQKFVNYPKLEDGTAFADD